MKDHVDKQELWYEEEEQEENNGQETIDFCFRGGQSLFNVSEVKNMNVAEALPTVGTINTTENLTDFTHKDFKQLAAKVQKEKQQDRGNYFEMEQRYREDKGSVNWKRTVILKNQFNPTQNAITE